MHFLVHPEYAIAHYFPMFDGMAEFLANRGLLVIPEDKPYMLDDEANDLLNKYATQKYESEDEEDDAFPEQADEDLLRQQVHRQFASLCLMLFVGGSGPARNVAP
jgi:hypothetical protein